MKRIIWISGFLCLLAGAYLFGPRFGKPEYDGYQPKHNYTIGNVEQLLLQNEAIAGIRPDNEARIVWANDTVREKTPLVILYLHGFSASWYEGHPTHNNLAKALHANLLLSRLHAHGLNHPDAFASMYPDSLYFSALEALSMARVLGHKVLVMGTSTGGTLALKMAADYPELVDAVVLLSPNIEINNPAASLLVGPWGLQIARATGGGGKYRQLGPGIQVEQDYWYREYRWEAVVFLQQLIQSTMKKSTFQKVSQPLFLGYYYRDEENQDQTVKVSAMLEMFRELSTPDSLKVAVAFPNANQHVIGNGDLSGCAPVVENAILDFIKTKLIIHEF
jgi:pimeloyl-ACP methyl ester carboxylesterase